MHTAFPHLPCHCCGRSTQLPQFLAQQGEILIVSEKGNDNLCEKCYVYILSVMKDEIAYYERQIQKQRVSYLDIIAAWKSLAELQISALFPEGENHA